MEESKPVFTHILANGYRLTWICAALLTIVTLAGILLPNMLYPSEEYRQSFIPNDVTSLIVGLPLLIGSMWLTRRGNLAGLLVWPGALLFITYNYIAYTWAFAWTIPSIFYLILIVLSGVAVYFVIKAINPDTIQPYLTGKVHEKLTGGVLTGLGGLFFLRGVGQVIGGLSGQTFLSSPEIAVLVADLVITPLWIAGGILIWRHHPLGYLTAGGLLFQASLLFVSLLVFFILQPVLLGVPFATTDFIVIFGMGLICFIPTIMFLRNIKG